MSSYLGGRTPADLLRLHERYGPVVRTSPDTLSYVKTPQWKEIYGHRLVNGHELRKDEKYFSGLAEVNILNADRHYHGYLRKLLAHGFSKKAMREQESVLKDLVDLLFRRLRDNAKGGDQPMDILQWYNFTTFDFIGHLTFGESFHCLENSELHTWVNIFFSLARFMALHQVLSRLPAVLRIPVGIWAVPSTVRRDVETLKRLQAEKVKYRIGNKASVADFMEKLIAAYEDGNMTFAQLESNSQVLVAAGSETTATALSGLTYLLVKHPDVHEKLKAEIRGAFRSPDDITFTSVNECKYLLACIEEALRIYPPSPQPHHRIVPPGGAVVDGQVVPGGMSVSIPIYASSHSPLNWTEPDAFIPERWLGEDQEGEAFARDERASSNPFSFGPRACVGRNLAYAEMKMIVARLVWEFDVEDATEGDWFDQKVFMIWDKAPLWVKLHPVRDA